VSKIDAIESIATDEEAVHSVNDQDLEKLLNKIGHKITEALNVRPIAPSTSRPNSLTQTQTILGISVSCVVIIGAAWAGLHYVVSSAITDALKDPSSKLTTITEQTVDLRRDVDRLLDKVASTDIKDFQQPELIKDAAIRLQQRGIKVASVDAITKKAKALLPTSPAKPSDPQWDAYLALIGYRSSLINVKVDPSSHVGLNSTLYPNAGVRGKPNYALKQSLEGAPMEAAARLEFISEPMNRDVSMGPAVLFVEGGTMNLDNLNMRHVVVNGTEIHYSGEPLRLEDVIFLNCTFVFDDSTPTRNLAAAILLESNSISFRAS